MAISVLPWNSAAVNKFMQHSVKSCSPLKTVEL